jgi:hypothetical protein
MIKKRSEQFFRYLILLGQKWRASLALLLDIIAYVVGYANPKFAVDLKYYIIYAALVFVWAGFEVYRETLEKIPKHKEALWRLDVSLVEGSEYYFDLGNEVIFKNKVNELKEEADLYKEVKDYSELPPINVTFKGRIENSGNVPLSILNINGKMDQLKPFAFENFDKKVLNYSDFPVSIYPGGIVFFEIKAKIYYRFYGNGYEEFNAPQVAARIKPIINAKACGQLNIQLEANEINRTGDPRKFGCVKDIPLRPLCELLISYWQQYDILRLLQLAGAPRK